MKSLRKSESRGNCREVEENGGRTVEKLEVERKLRPPTPTPPDPADGRLPRSSRPFACLVCFYVDVRVIYTSLAAGTALFVRPSTHFPTST